MGSALAKKFTWHSLHCFYAKNLLTWYPSVRLNTAKPAKMPVYIHGHTPSRVLRNEYNDNQRPRLAIQKVSPLYQRNLLAGRFIFEDPLHGGVRRS